MLRRYRNEPVPSERRSASDDELRAPESTDSTTSTGTGALDVPYAGSGGRGSQQYHRPPFGVGLAVAAQDPDMGAEVKQTGAGRAFIPPTLSFPVQSPTPEPDRRRIARPMPSEARDADQVIRPSGARNG